MKKLKLLIENFLVYGLGGTISKIIPLVMVPIIARMMPSTKYYGISDLFTTIVSFACATAIMGMYDAMYRLFFEKEDKEYKVRICSTTLFFCLLTSIIAASLLIIFRRRLSILFFDDYKLDYLVIMAAIATIVGATNNIVSAPTRMQNKRGVFLVTNTISPIISYSAALIMLKKGLYVMALPIATIIANFAMEVSFFCLNRKWFDFKKIDKTKVKPMLYIGLPLLPNFIIYWIFNSCDKIMITNTMGMSAAGIYSVASKLGHCSQLIYTAFAGGWQFFAFSTMNDKDQVESNSMIFEYLGVISFAVTAVVCAWSYKIMTILFPIQYVEGYISAPYLFLAPLLLMLYQIIGNQFLIIKKTWPSMLTLAGGAVVNIFLNLFLIPKIGIEGASIATLLGYVISLVVCSIVLCKMGLLVVSSRFYISTFTMVIFFVVWRLYMSKLLLQGNFLALLCIVLWSVLYRRDLYKLFFLIKGKKS